MKTATFIRESEMSSGAVHRLYRLSEPLDGYEFVIVSAQTFKSPRWLLVGFFMEPETYIFGANSDGELARPLEQLDGSFRGEANHAKALENAGYLDLQGIKRAISDTQSKRR